MRVRIFLFIIVASKNKIMCLYTSQRVPKIAESPIRCLKVVDVVGGEFVPHFVYNSRVRYVVGEETCTFLDAKRFGNAVVHGLHVFSEGNALAAQVDEVTDPVAVLECEIPVGARYYAGSVTYFSAAYCHGHTAYCTERLRVIRRLGDDEVEELKKKQTGDVSYQ